MTATKRRGRPSKPGVDREPNGRIQRPGSSRAPVPAIQRALETIHREQLNPLLGTPFGRLLLEQKITRPEFEAGERFLALKASVDRIQGYPARSPAGIDMDRVQGRSLRGEELSEQQSRSLRRLEQAEGALGVRTPGGRWWVIDQLVVHGIPLATYEQFLKLRAGLTALVEHWGMRA